MLEAIQALDASAVLFIQDCIRSDALNTVMVLFSRMGDAGAVWLLTGVIFFASRRFRNRGFNVIVCVAVCWILSEALRLAFDRPRPFETLSQLSVLITPPSSSSFPSGHAAIGFAAAYAYARGIKYGALAYIIAVPIAFSRIYNGVHYPSDVIAGAIFGTVVAVIVCALSARFIKIPEYETDLIEVDDDEAGDDEDKSDV